MLAAKLKSGAAAARHEPVAPPSPDDGHLSYPKAPTGKPTTRNRPADTHSPGSGGSVQDIMTSPSLGPADEPYMNVRRHRRGNRVSARIR
jgi:hypothetical protein